MNPKLGRPFTENPRKHKIEIRMNDEELTQLDFCCQQLGDNRSNLLRTGAVRIYEALKKEEENSNKDEN